MSNEFRGRSACFCRNLWFRRLPGAEAQLFLETNNPKLMIAIDKLIFIVYDAVKLADETIRTSTARTAIS
jgi:hypothetical protein